MNYQLAAHCPKYDKHADASFETIKQCKAHFETLCRIYTAGSWQAHILEKNVVIEAWNGEQWIGTMPNEFTSEEIL